MSYILRTQRRTTSPVWESAMRVMASDEILVRLSVVSLRRLSVIH
jgi:hypothetical protein